VTSVTGLWGIFMTTVPTQIDFEKAFDDYWKLIYSICRRYSDEQDAEDMMHDVFIKALKTQHKYNPERGSVKVWLMQIAFAERITRFRKIYGQGKEPRPVEVSMEEPNLFFKDGGVESIFGYSFKKDQLADPHSVIDVVERKRMVETLLKKSSLTPKQKDFVRLFLEDKTYREIADETGETHKAVSIYGWRAMTILRKALTAPIAVAEPEPEIVRECLWCKTPFTVKPSDTNQNRKFCKENCGQCYRYHERRALKLSTAPAST
jgi:RNA polymerase sigma factor (sigma-70 family)